MIQIQQDKLIPISGSRSVELNNVDTATASFTAPKVLKDTTFQFMLTVTDNEGAKGEDTVKVKVKALPTTTTTTITTEPLSS